MCVVIFNTHIVLIKEKKVDYVKHYISLIIKSKNRTIVNGTYSEKHHIIPKSIFSSKMAQNVLCVFKIKYKYGKENKVRLLPEEHYIAHLLLVKIFENIDTNCYEKMVYAASLMRSRCNNNKTYCFLRKRYSEVLSKNRIGKPSGMSGKKWSKERKEQGNVLKGKTYEEIYGEEKAKKLKERRSTDRKGKKLEEIYGIERAEEIRAKISNRVITDECRSKNSKAHKGVHISEKTKQRIKEYMSDDKKNPNVDQTEYEFKNIYTGEIIKARKFDMRKIYGCVLMHKVIRGERFHNRGWSFVRMVKNED